jgi:phosphatidylserine decarboxylase
VPDRLAVWVQYLLPKQALTVLAGWVAERRARAFVVRLIAWFVRRYGVDLSEAEQPAPAAYETFNAFFTRSLRPGARPLADTDLVCPVDGAISQFGAIEHGQIFQAKGHLYSAAALLGGDAALAATFDTGHYATLYLSPKDYHRIHMPCTARLRRMVHVPGTLFSVNPATARGVPGLFARNERVVCLFDTEWGALAMVLVGATIVGSTATVWHGVVSPPRPSQPRIWRYDDAPVVLRRGDEMGRFLLGSTVVVLCPSRPLQFEPAWAPGGAVRCGQAMASFTPAR